METAIATEVPPKADGLEGMRLVFAVLPLMVAASLCTMDTVIANVALPSIAATLNALPADCVWIVNAFQLPLAMLILPLSSLGDRLGYRRIYMMGLFVFTLASLFCAISGTLNQLIAARVLQGIGAAGINSVNIAIVKQIYPSRLLGRGVGINACVVGFGAAAGPTVAAIVLSFGPWPWLFWVNVPLGIIGFIMSYLALPRETPARAEYDFASAALNAASIGLLMFGVERAGHGHFGLLSIAQVIAAIVCIALLVRREKDRKKPMLPVDLLRKAPFALAVLTAITSFIVQGLSYVSLPFMLHERGFGPVLMGAVLTPWPVAIICTAPFAGYLTDRCDAAMLSGIGLIALAAGTAALAMTPVHASIFYIGACTALCGAGFAFFQAPNNKSILMQCPPGRAGNGSGMIGTSRLLGQIIGATSCALILSVSPKHIGPIALFTASACAFVAAGVSFWRMTKGDFWGRFTKRRFEQV